MLNFVQAQLYKQAQRDSTRKIWMDETKPDTLRLQALYDFAWNGYVFNQPDSALYFSEILFEMANKSNSAKYLGFSKNIKGVAYQRKGDLNLAEKYLNESVKILEESNFIRETAASYGNLGSIAFNKGEVEKSKNYYFKCLKIADEYKEVKVKANVLNSIGNLYYNTGKYLLAQEYYQKALIENERLNVPSGVANAYNNLGNIEMMLGYYDSTIDYYQKALIIYQNLNYKVGVANIYNSLGITYMEQCNYVLALDNLLKGLEIIEEIKDPKRKAAILQSIGVAYQKQGFLSKSINFLKQSLEIFIQIEDVYGLGGVYNNLGVSYFYDKKYDEALAYYFKSDSIFKLMGNEVGRAYNFNTIANVFEKKSYFTQSMSYCDSALSVFQNTKEPYGLGWSYNNLAEKYLTQKNYQKSIDFSKKGFEIFSNLKIDEKKGNAASNLYSSYIQLNQTDSALKFLKFSANQKLKSIQTNYFILSEEEKTMFFNSIEYEFQKYYDFALFYSKKYPAVLDTVFNLCLITKGLSLKSSSFLRQTIRNSQDTALIHIYDEWILLKKEISDKYGKGENIDSLEELSNQIEKQLILKSGVYSDFTQMMKINWQSVQSKLKKGEAIVEFIHFESEIDTTKPVIYAALVLKPEGKPQIIQLCNENELKSILSKEGNPKEKAEKIYENTLLYEKLWKPLELAIKGSKTIFYSPSGLLHRISFAAIQLKKNLYLCDQMKLRHLNSTVSLVQKTQNKTHEQYLLAGGIEYSSNKSQHQIWKDLPGTKEETNKIHDLLDQKKIKNQYFYEAQATEKNIKWNMKESGVIHISTHGFFFTGEETFAKTDELEEKKEENLVFRSPMTYANWTFVKNKNPLMRSGLVLSHANDVWSRESVLDGEDGILTAQEVASMDLHHTKLVVLSACETGLGEIKGSEGVFGLQRAFKMAGVQNIVMSLWQVSDHETAIFMTYFHEQMLKSGSVSTAFQLTQKFMRKNYAPYYWAAFVCLE